MLGIDLIQDVAASTLLPWSIGFGIRLSSTVRKLLRFFYLAWISPTGVGEFWICLQNDSSTIKWEWRRRSFEPSCVKFYRFKKVGRKEGRKKERKKSQEVRLRRVTSSGGLSKSSTQVCLSREHHQTNYRVHRFEFPGFGIVKIALNLPRCHTEPRL